MPSLIRPLALLSLLLSAALFGFFYAWVCSTMWGLDTADPRVAIAAMQAMNASVRNAVFAPAFFGTAPVLLLTAFVILREKQSGAALWFGLAGVMVAVLAVALTAAFNIPMNEALAGVAVPQDIEAARIIWAEYSTQWQVWNQIRTVTSGVAVLFVGIGIMRLGSA
ncbi:DUF1772 domain-containing protein [Sulfitobacter mediterraneus]|uniref:anthrone oxygenase family protein n=1 Tax=Sulfitobacter mediterraneus TaxID=83219 RepID=UPI001934910D|nr:anthrone oxygenase family protein [Sulfitobacter mediterraneus]MBM1632597.1 DUF1772 domain-containing protein [Sulfitobacter mediterraneus]MBM1641269.1 DUF1772 domain-containing protein [Sulfitobacter mediterraneus]MBM1644462.1 DUF1772 domain-containing protein [Sulfitobacter mediterraneus]MBM1649389.1 DUF1772 domain-containing protein [Sulfitobacter mediterraneus]MBM1653410.1 DUF1772 domain-containing protein [Sulfitobacter mediterraneus]